MRARRNASVIQSQKDNVAMFIVIYMRSFNDLVNAVMRRGLDRSSAENAVERAYDRVMTALLKYENADVFKGNPHAFVHNTIMNAVDQYLGSRRNPRGMMRMRRNPPAAAGRAPKMMEMPKAPWAEVYPNVKRMLKKNMSVLVLGSPGIGKSSMAKQLAKEIGEELGIKYVDKKGNEVNGMPMIDIRLSQIEPQELAGIFFPEREGTSSGTIKRYVPSWLLKAANEPCFVFLDEINAAVSDAAQAVAYQIVLDRALGDVRLHPGTRVMAAGNLSTDKALARDLSSALSNRFAHFSLDVDDKEWLQWARTSNINKNIIDYMESLGSLAKSELFNDGSTTTDEGGAAIRQVAWPSPRSWEMVSKVMEINGDTPNVDTVRMIISCIGENATFKFLSWMHVRTLAKGEDVFIKGEMVDYNKNYPKFSLTGRSNQTAKLLQGPENMANRVSLAVGLADWLVNDDKHEVQDMNVNKVAGNVVQYLLDYSNQQNSAEGIRLFLSKIWFTLPRLVAELKKDPEFCNAIMPLVRSTTLASSSAAMNNPRRARLARKHRSRR